jgi:hypothetical protein
MKLTKLALGLVVASAGAFGMSSAAFAGDSTLNGNGVNTSTAPGNNAAAVIQTVEINGVGKSSNISAAVGQKSAAATAGTQINVGNTAATLTGSAAGSNSSEVNTSLNQGGNGSNQGTTYNTVKLGL